MSTIASPRISISGHSPSASSRTSLDTTNNTVPPSRPTHTRRNRAALREFYGLKSPTDVEAGPGEPAKAPVEESLLDREGFDSAAYARDVLARRDLKGVLSVQASLMGEIRNLDGERKALVYDNYSKLITATETIRKLRTNMEPLTPATSSLSPSVSHISETASSLSTFLLQGTSHAPSIVTENIDDVLESDNNSKKKKNAQQTVRWVLDSPRRLSELVDEGKEKQAKKDWREVKKLLERWKSVEGVDEVKARCEDVMKSIGDK